MKPQKIGDTVYLVCTRCGFKMKATEKDLKAYKLSTKIKHTEKEKLVVIPADEELKGLPITRDVVCPRCGNHEAYYWFVQTRSADEPPTRFFKCTRCGYVWREYD
jgi:DNA-directed RNA polymerase subunit M